MKRILIASMMLVTPATVNAMDLATFLAKKNAVMSKGAVRASIRGLQAAHGRNGE
jgi:hypothetical protein